MLINSHSLILALVKCYTSSFLYGEDFLFSLCTQEYKDLRSVKDRDLFYQTFFFTSIQWILITLYRNMPSKLGIIEIFTLVRL
jgi:hypothetical protein